MVPDNPARPCLGRNSICCILRHAVTPQLVMLLSGLHYHIKYFCEIVQILDVFVCVQFRLHKYDIVQYSVNHWFLIRLIKSLEKCKMVLTHLACLKEPVHWEVCIDLLSKSWPETDMLASELSHFTQHCYPDYTLTPLLGTRSSILLCNILSNGKRWKWSKSLFCEESFWRYSYGCTQVSVLLVPG